MWSRNLYDRQEHEGVQRVCRGADSLVAGDGLRRHLTKDVTFVGVSSRVEIWDTSRWNQVNGELTEESIAEAMDELGI